MNAADLAKDVTYMETMAKALANTSANLVGDVADLRARLEKMPAIVTDVRIGPGEYHYCPRDPAPMKKLADIVVAGGLVLVENSAKVIYRLLEYNADTDTAIITPFRNEMGRVQLPSAGRQVYAYTIYLKLNA